MASSEPKYDYSDETVFDPIVADHPHIYSWIFKYY